MSFMKDQMPEEVWMWVLHGGIGDWAGRQIASKEEIPWPRRACVEEGQKGAERVKDWMKYKKTTYPALNIL